MSLKFKFKIYGILILKFHKKHLLLSKNLNLSIPNQSQNNSKIFNLIKTLIILEIVIGDLGENMKGCLKKQLTSQMDMAESLRKITYILKMANSKITADMDILDISTNLATINITKLKMAQK